ncbi:MAG TPA: DNA mismatch repair endonuclease MutL [Ignavibacteriaceae bacterium]|nr:DNA mismatch repair endonuclease MutL [Ignavibacteriaceae bacterium]
MAKRIKILPDSIASKIAAGEVVQRPESVVKELMENAIDAGAKNIELIIKRAGKNFIQVCDDGIGMSEEDLILCVQKYATSKIEAFEDLEAIKTLGFRGEALSSISAVSQIEIRSETRDEEIGTVIKNDEAGNIKVDKGSFPKGTCVSVKNLFFNVPARRKFLKTDTTEFKHIVDTFNRIALSHTSISFKLFNGVDPVFDYPAESLKERVGHVFGENMPDALIPVEERTELISVYGYIGKPSLLRKTKGEQYLFLNSRYITNKNINHAVFSAYENILEKGDYPFFILFIEIDPERIDVNIHPSKLEAKFDDEKDVYNFILSVVRKSLGSHDLVPSMVFSQQDLSEEKLAVNKFQPANRGDFSDRPGRERYQPEVKRYSEDEIDLLFGSITDDVVIKKEGKAESKLFSGNDQKEISHDKAEQTTTLEKTEESPFIIQLHTKYILSQIKSGLMIIDQHVAHERILYEKALNRLETDIPFSQQLLFPKKVKTDPARSQLLKELEPYLTRLGFQLKFLAKETVKIEGVPDDVRKGTEEQVLFDLLEEYSTNEREKHLEQKDNLAKSYSCKTAIKAGDRLDERAMRLLIDQLFATSMPYVCPHGRPIVIKISLNEFDRRFGRT